MWCIYTAGLTWRYYGTQRFVGGFGIDLEFLQQGFSFATNASLVEEPKDFTDAKQRAKFFSSLQGSLYKEFRRLRRTDPDRLVSERYEKYRKIGRCAQYSVGERSVRRWNIGVL